MPTGGTSTEFQENHRMIPRGLNHCRPFRECKLTLMFSSTLLLRRCWARFFRSAAEQSLTAWRSLGDDGRAGAAASLLSLGHLVLQLHGVGAGIEEARCGLLAGYWLGMVVPGSRGGMARHTCWDSCGLGALLRLSLGERRTKFREMCSGRFVSSTPFLCSALVALLLQRVAFFVNRVYR